MRTIRPAFHARLSSPVQGEGVMGRRHRVKQYELHVTRKCAGSCGGVSKRHPKSDTSPRSLSSFVPERGVANILYCSSLARYSFLTRPRLHLRLLPAVCAQQSAMPKRTLSIHSVEERSDGFAPKRGLFRRLTMSSRKLFGGAFAPSPAAAEPMTQRTSIVQKAMQARRMSVQAAVDEISVTFAQKTAIDISGLPQLPTRPSGPNPEALPAFHVVEPAKGKTHTATLILLHGFTCSGSQLAHELMPGLKQRLYPSAYQHMRFVFLTTPGDALLLREPQPGRERVA